MPNLRLFVKFWPIVSTRVDMFLVGFATFPWRICCMKPETQEMSGTKLVVYQMDPNGLPAVLFQLGGISFHQLPCFFHSKWLLLQRKHCRTNISLGSPGKGCLVLSSVVCDWATPSQDQSMILIPLDHMTYVYHRIAYVHNCIKRNAYIYMYENYYLYIYIYIVIVCL